MRNFAALLRRNRWLALALAAEAAVLLVLTVGLFGAPYRAASHHPRGVREPVPLFRRAERRRRFAADLQRRGF